MASPFRHVAVVGAGLIGGSVALAARRVDGVEEVIVHDADPGALRAAVDRGLIITDDAASAVAVADLVVVAVPVDVVVAVVEEIAPSLAPGAVVTDVTSVKASVVGPIEAVVDRAGAAFVGGHPMAGSELEGMSGADPTLFEGATWVLTPTERSSDAAFQGLGIFLRALGARVLAVDPVTHDRLVAVVSHLPQLVASSLMRFAGAASGAEPGLLALAGAGFRDVTRVAGSNPALWRGIVTENRSAVLEALDEFLAELRSLRNAVSDADWTRFERVLDEARTARARMPGKDVAVTPVDLVIPVADRAGALAEVTTALGAAGINIEDLSMRHGDGRGALVVTVAGADVAHAAQEVLAARGTASHVETR